MLCENWVPFSKLKGLPQGNIFPQEFKPEGEKIWFFTQKLEGINDYINYVKTKPAHTHGWEPLALRTNGGDWLHFTYLAPGFLQYS